jgi:hypothetical protein
MRVNIYDIDNRGTERLRAASVELSECIDRTDKEYVQALNQLNHMGRYWGGGGASPIFMLIRTGGDQ